MTSLAFQVSKMGFFFSIGLYFKSKVVKGSHKGTNMFVLISGHFFSKCTIFVFVAFFLTQRLSNQLSFSVTVGIYKIRVFDRAFSFLTIITPMVTKLFRVVTCCKVRCCLVVEAGNRQGAELVAETPKHDPLIINIRSSDCLKNLYISILMRFIGNKLGRLLTIGRIFSTQTLKSSPISC